MIDLNQFIGILDEDEDNYYIDREYTLVVEKTEEDDDKDATADNNPLYNTLQNLIISKEVIITFKYY